MVQLVEGKIDPKETFDSFNIYYASSRGEFKNNVV